MLYLTFAADVVILLAPFIPGAISALQEQSAERWAVGSQPGQQTLIGKT